MILNNNNNGKMICLPRPKTSAKSVNFVVEQI